MTVEDANGTEWSDEEGGDEEEEEVDVMDRWTWSCESR